MITKNEIKYYSSLLKKKSRDEENKFIVEGNKIVIEGLQSNFQCEIIFAAKKFSDDNKQQFNSLLEKNFRLEILKEQDFSKISDTITPQGIAAVFNKPFSKNFIDNISSDFVVCLENISDPGNLGTIIRNCDWFGIKEMLLIDHCADIYNSKTIRASMGSIFHLNIFYEEENECILKKLKKSGFKVLCADLKGNNIYKYSLTGKTVVIFSNEARGPSEGILNLSDEIVTIPRRGSAESLNVAGASAVILGHLTNCL